MLSETVMVPGRELEDLRQVRASTDPKISLVLLTLNPGPDFDAILQSVLTQDSTPFEVLAIDSGSTDGTIERLRSAGIDVDVIPQGEFGHGRTRNLAVGRAKGELIAFLTHDALPASSSWLREMSAPFADPTVAGVYGRQVAPSDTNALETHLLTHVYPAGEKKVSLQGQRFRMTTHLFSNANSMIRKLVWEKIPFPSDIIMCEDQWWAKAALKAGYSIVYNASAIVVHSNHLGVRAAFRRGFDTGVAMKGCDERPLLVGVLNFLNYLWSLTRFIGGRGEWSQFPSALTLVMSRAVGYFIGSYSAYLPRWACRSLSQYRGYWK